MKKLISILLVLTTFASFVPFSAQAVTAPAVVCNLTVEKNGTGAKVYWNKVSGAKGYLIYRKKGLNGKFAHLKTVSACSYIDKKIDKSSTYYYAVKAYKVSGGKNIYGKFCSDFSFSLAWQRVSGSGTGARSKAQVNGKYLANSKLSVKNTFSSNPKATKPFACGELSKTTKDNVLARVNYYRWLCGLSSVTYDKGYSVNNQWGAVLQHNMGVTTHTASKKPAGMTDSDFKKAQKGISCNSDSSVGKISGNCWRADSAVKSIDYFINDDESYSPTLISHRSALLDPSCGKISFGATGKYVALSTFSGGKNTAGYYAFPAAGYYPNASIDTDAPWSIRLAKGYSTTASTNVKLYYAGKVYPVKKIYNTKSYWYSFDYYVPSELKKAICAGGAYKDGVSVTVKVSGLKYASSNNGWICYRVHFFKAK